MSLSRRAFHRSAALIGAGAVVGALPSGVAAADDGVERRAVPPIVGETDTEITVDNGRIRAVLLKGDANGRVTSLQLDGQELIGPRGKGRFDQVVKPFGDQQELPKVPTEYSIKKGRDFVVVTVLMAPTTAGPYTREWNYIFRSGETGFHLSPRFAHQAGHQPVVVEQHRFVCWLDPKIFTHVSLEDDPFGDPWRQAAAELPTPDQLAAAPEVMDATYDLQGMGSDYARRFYSKYDWAISMRDHVVHGLYGKAGNTTYGIFAVLANRESFNGGPDRQDLTLHQTGDAPVLLLEPHAAHYGSMTQTVEGDWSKTYGPYFVFLGKGVDGATLRREALRHGSVESHQRFYDRVGLDDWATRRDRVTVAGKIHLPREGSGRALVILSDNQTPAQDSVSGFQYWAEVSRAGTFDVDHVRPGTYRLTAQRSGVWGDLEVDDVVVPESAGGGRHRLGALSWPSADHGETQWQIGIPNRTSLEFSGGDRSRRYDSLADYASDFPDGVVYTVSDSTDSDWFFTQQQRIDGVDQPPWQVNFDLDGPLDPAAKVTLTVALAAWSLDSAVPAPCVESNLSVRFNDARSMLWTFAADDAKGATYRSSNHGRNFVRAFEVDPTDLRVGRNVLALTINEGVTGTVNQATYDALRLQIAP